MNQMMKDGIILRLVWLCLVLRINMVRFQMIDERFKVGEQAVFGATPVTRQRELRIPAVRVNKRRTTFAIKIWCQGTHCTTCCSAGLP